jgi:CSLREA domain-containing protein
MRLKTLGPSLIRLAYLGSLLLGLPATAAAAPTSPFTVDSTLDNPDASPGNSLCADSNGACTLRAAVMEANAHVGPDTILLPVDTFHLIIPGVG